MKQQMLEAEVAALRAEVSRLTEENEALRKRPVVVDVAGVMGAMSPEVVAAMAPILVNPMIAALEVENDRLRAERAETETERWQRLHSGRAMERAALNGQVA